MSTFQPESGVPPPAAPLKPHRGTTVLVLGILGLVVCFICGIIAWVMGNNDLREMNQRIMDPAGRGMTNAGRICGMVSVGLAVLWVVFLIIYAVAILPAISQAIPR